MLTRPRARGTLDSARAPGFSRQLSRAGGRGRRACGLLRDGASDGTNVAQTQSKTIEISEAAERYAQAAFELGRDQKALDKLEADFAAFDAAWAASADLRNAASSPLIDPAEKARALVAVAAKLGLSDLGQKVIGVAAQNRRANEWPAIAAAFRAKLARERGARQAEIISAKPLSDAERDQIVAALKKSLGAEIDAQTKVDERLIGGFIVRVGSRQFDASLRAKLDSLKLALKTA